MSRPNEVRILGQRFGVHWIDERAVTSVPRITSEVKAGRSSTAYQWMSVDTDQGPDQQRDTLLHEILHCCLGVLGHDEDDVVDHLAPVLLDALRANPEIVDFLMEREP